MFNLSLFRRLTGSILPTSPESISISGDDNNTAIGVFAPELLDRITDHLHHDIPTLLRLGLACRQTLIRSRLHLFSELEFTKDGDRQFDMFLTLLEAPWTSFTNTVESLHVKELFHPRGPYKYLPNKDLRRILANLANLKTLRLTSILWPCIPPHIRDFFFQTNIADLQLHSVEFPSYVIPHPGIIHIVELFVLLQPSVKSVTLYDLRFHDDPIPDLSQHSSTFRRRIHLTSLDTYSLLLFKDVWDPLRANDLDITVESFHIRLVPMRWMDRATYTPFFSRFLRRVGPSLHRISIKFSDPTFDPRALSHYENVDLSRCVNVRIIHVGTITLDHTLQSGEQMLPMLSAMWNSLSTLPYHSPSLKEVVLIFRPEFRESREGMSAELEIFAWLDLVGKLQEMFPHLKTITVGVSCFVGEDFVPYLAALRRAPGIRQLEEKGTVLLRRIPWETDGSTTDCPIQSGSGLMTSL